MPRQRLTALFVIALISFAFTGVVSRADRLVPTPAGQAATDKPAAPTAAQQLMTVQGFKEALPAKAAEELDMQGFIDLKAKGGVVVLDLRSKEVFARKHLTGSVIAPLTDLTDKNLPTLVPGKDTPVVLACDYSFAPVRTIAMTMQAYPVLYSQGYKNIYRLNLWQTKGGGPMVTDADQEKALSFEGTDVKPPATTTPAQ